MRIIKTQPTIWEELDGVLPVQAVNKWRGMNKLDRFSIDSNFFTDSKNLTSRNFPAAATRPGFTQIGTTQAAKILGLASWKDTELHTISNANWYRYSGGVWGSLLAGLSVSANWQFCNFKGGFADYNLLGTNGVDTPKKYDGATVTALAGAPAAGNYVDTHDNRVYMTVGNKVYYSALSLAEDWTSTDPYVGSGEIAIETEAGKDIVGLRAGTGHLLAYYPQSCYELYGTGPDDYRMIQVASDIGLLSDQAVVNVAGILYWPDTNGIYVYRGGSRPSRNFSQPVQYYIDNLNDANKSKACAGTDGKRFYLALPTGASADPNVILEYDPEFSGVWYTWEDFSPLNFANAAGELYWGDTAGKIVQLIGTTDAGAAIAFMAVTIPFGSRIAAQNVRWHKMWLIAEVPVGSTCSIYLSPSDIGDADWTLVKTLTTSSSVQKKKVIIPVGTVADAGWIRVKFEGTGPVTIRELDYVQREMPFR